MSTAGIGSYRRGTGGGGGGGTEVKRFDGTIKQSIINRSGGQVSLFYFSSSYRFFFSLPPPPLSHSLSRRLSISHPYVLISRRPCAPRRVKGRSRYSWFDGEINILTRLELTGRFRTVAAESQHPPRSAHPVPAVAAASSRTVRADNVITRRYDLYSSAGVACKQWTGTIGRGRFSTWTSNVFKRNKRSQRIHQKPFVSLISLF